VGDYPLLPRLAETTFRDALEVHPIVVLMGARQTGKSTLVRSLPSSESREYLTLDDLDIRGQARTAPDDLVHRADLITFDEIQREPGLLLSLKRAVDERRPRRRGQFVLTGSANLLLMSRVSETLAGRAGYISLWPLTRRERLGLGTAGIWTALLQTPVGKWMDLVRSQKIKSENWQDAAKLGGYPTPAYELDSERARYLWYQGYVQTYLERDLQDLSAIDNLVDFQRLMRATCLRLGSMINMTELSRDTGVPRQSIQRYLNLLETSCLLVRVEPYAVNRTKRLIKSPKLYWSDTGLALFLSGVSDPGGTYLENLVVHDLIAWRDAQIPRPNVLYWRTASGQEVDFVIEHRQGLLPIEIKATARPTTADAQHLLAFRQEYGSKVRGALLLHTGAEVFWIARDVLAAPWWKVI
jgi:predicted AAA+ superfamily ATPase